MTTGEVLTGLALTGSASAWVYLQARGYISKKDEKLDTVVEHVGEIRTALLGGIGNPGMAKRLDTLEEGQARLEADVDEIKRWMRAQQGHA